MNSHKSNNPAYEPLYCIFKENGIYSFYGSRLHGKIEQLWEDPRQSRLRLAQGCLYTVVWLTCSSLVCWVREIPQFSSAYQLQTPIRWHSMRRILWKANRQWRASRGIPNLTIYQRVRPGIKQTNKQTKKTIARVKYNLNYKII